MGLTGEELEERSAARGARRAVAGARQGLSGVGARKSLQATSWYVASPLPLPSVSLWPHLSLFIQLRV
jgi:hypothetical protein